MEKSRAIELLEHLAWDRDIERNPYGDALNMAIEALKAQLSSEGTTSDLISRRAAIDIERNATVDTNPSHFEAHQKFTQFMDDAEISSFGRWQWSNGFNTALTAVGIDLKKLPPAQPEPTDINAKEAVYNLAEKIGIHQLFALTVELRGEPIQPEPTDEQVLDYCKKRCLHIVTSDVFQSTHLTRNVSFGDKDHVWIDGKQYISLRRFQEAVKEAQPKEGHWIEGGIYRDIIECYCSECGQIMTTAATVRMNYCPNCGAKMKGERQK